MSVPIKALKQTVLIEVILTSIWLVWQPLPLGKGASAEPSQQVTVYKMNGRKHLEAHNTPLPITQAKEGKRFLLNLAGLRGSPKDLYVSGYNTPKQSNNATDPAYTAAHRPPRPAPLPVPLRSDSLRPPLGTRLLTHVQHTLCSGHLAPGSLSGSRNWAHPLLYGPAPPSRSALADPAHSSEGPARLRLTVSQAARPARRVGWRGAPFLDPGVPGAQCCCKHSWLKSARVCM